MCVKHWVFMSLVVLLGCGKAEEKPTTSPNYLTVGSPTGKVTSNKYCTGVSGAIVLRYQLVKYDTGDAMVTCSVSDPASQYTWTTVYRSVDPGASSGGCNITYDVDAATGGFFEFSGASATYRDVGSGSNGTILALTCA